MEILSEEGKLAVADRMPKLTLKIAGEKDGSYTIRVKARMFR